MVVVVERQDIGRFTFRSSTVFPQLISKKNPLWLPGGGGEKEPFKNKLEHSVLLYKPCPQRNLVNWWLNWGIIRA